MKSLLPGLISALLVGASVWGVTAYRIDQLERNQAVDRQTYKTQWAMVAEMRDQLALLRGDLKATDRETVVWREDLKRRIVGIEADVGELYRSRSRRSR